MSEALRHEPAALLDERSIAMLDFERHAGTGHGRREAEIRERFDMSAPRYHQLLNQLIDTPEALAHDPLLVKRLRRLRENRRAARSARALRS